jgi:hypothetical protein
MSHGFRYSVYRHGLPSMFHGDRPHATLCADMAFRACLTDFAILYRHGLPSMSHGDRPHATLCTDMACRACLTDVATLCTDMAFRACLTVTGHTPLCIQTWPIEHVSWILLLCVEMLLHVFRAQVWNLRLMPRTSLCAGPACRAYLTESAELMRTAR